MSGRHRGAPANTTSRRVVVVSVLIAVLVLIVVTLMTLTLVGSDAAARALAR